jgi:hypothetical protein
MIKKTFVSIIFLLLLSSLAIAKTADSCDIPKSIDHECQCNGFSFGIAKWEYNEDSSKFEKADEISGYSTSVTGDDSHAYWTSSGIIAGVVSKEATISYTQSGGFSDDFSKSAKNGISHVTLCGNPCVGCHCDNSCPPPPCTGDDCTGVPEFSPLTLLAAVAIAGLGLAYFRKN